MNLKLNNQQTSPMHTAGCRCASCQISMKKVSATDGFGGFVIRNVIKDAPGFRYVEGDLIMNGVTYNNVKIKHDFKDQNDKLDDVISVSWQDPLSIKDKEKGGIIKHSTQTGRTDSYNGTTSPNSMRTEFKSAPDNGWDSGPGNNPFQTSLQQNSHHISLEYIDLSNVPVKPDIDIDIDIDPPVTTPTTPTTPVKPPIKKPDVDIDIDVDDGPCTGMLNNGIPADYITINGIAMLRDKGLGSGRKTQGYELHICDMAQLPDGSTSEEQLEKVTKLCQVQLCQNDALTIKHIHITGTNIKDLEGIADLPNLEVLSFDRSKAYKQAPITDFHHLSSLKSLKRINKLTDQQFNILKSQLDNGQLTLPSGCEIDHEGDIYTVP